MKRPILKNKGGGSFMEGFLGLKSLQDFRETGPRFPPQGNKEGDI